MIYEDWGFAESPFGAKPLPPNEFGQRLLVGREQQTAQLIRRIETGPKLPTIEGLNGIGKTSIVNVAAFMLYQRHITESKGPLFIPCRRIFQLASNTDIPTFVTNVLIEVAQTLIERSHDLTKSKRAINTEPLNRWINSPQLNSPNFGATIAGFGLQGGNQPAFNTSEGFQNSGLRSTVTSWLNEIFPGGEGGVICTIDNLELLQQSETARALLEQLRDELFNIQGLRWILCGALGIVYGVVSTPRLGGYLHSPIALGEIADSYAPKILTSRLDAFATRRSPYMPILPDDFAHLYDILKGNLRTVLSDTDDYCLWIADLPTLPKTVEEKHSTFTTWLNARSESAYQSVRSELKPRTLEVFKFATVIGGLFSPSDYDSFGFNSGPVFRPKIAELEILGIVVSTKDESDKRRKTIQITPKGWLIHYHMGRTI